MKLARYNFSRKVKAREINNLVKDKRTVNLRAGFTLLKRNMLGFRQMKLQTDKGQL
jgi:hypothetical protein